MPQFMEEFACAECGQTGHATWKGEPGPQRVMLELSDGFTRAPGGNPATDSRISCAQCGAAQPQQLDTSTASPG